MRFSNKLAFIIVALIIVLGFLVFKFDRQDVPSSWKTFSDPQKGVTFKYPEKLDAAYIDTIDWPPTVQIIDQPFTCTEAGNETAPAGLTKKETIGGDTYCVTKRSEGAAGSIYVLYAYVFQKENKVAILTFGLRFPQCENYDAPQKMVCENERANFNINNIIDQVAGSLKVDK